MTKLVFFGLDEHEQDVIWKAFVGPGDYEITLHAEPLTRMSLPEDSPSWHRRPGAGVRPDAVENRIRGDL